MAKSDIEKKRKLEDELTTTQQPQDGDSSSDSESEEIVNVDFDYFDPEEIDFHAIKNLLRQLLDADSTLFDLSAISDLIISQGAMGSTVKTDGKESDPFALLTILNLKENKSKPVFKALIDYFILKTQESPEFNRKLRQLFVSTSTSKVGLIIGERLINMPTEVVPPMYKMLVDEIAQANSKNQPFDFDYIILLSKTFTEEESQLDKEEKRQNKKGKLFENPKETYYFHPEDEVIQSHALFHKSYSFTNESQNADSRRAFQESGIYPTGHLILLESNKLPAVVVDLENKFPPF